MANVQYPPSVSSIDVITGSKDKSVGVVSNGQLCCRLQHAHKSPVSAVLHLEGTVLASADDDGTIKVWDLRTFGSASEGALKPALTLSEQEGTITELAVDSSTGTLLATSNDGTLIAYDLRQSKPKVQDRSNCFEEDLLSLAVLKHGQKVVVGSQEGNLHIFSRELLQVSDDRITGHPLSIDTIAKVDEDTIITGCEDGLVRGIGIHPNKILCVLYGLNEGAEKGVPIQRVAVSCDQVLGGAISESHLGFFNLQYLKQRDKTVPAPQAHQPADSFFDNLSP